jgi:hypothetical protein
MEPMSPLDTAMSLGAAGGAVTAVAIFAANAQVKRKPWASYTNMATYAVVTVCYPLLGACLAGFSQLIGPSGAAIVAGFTGLAALAKLAGEVRDAASAPEQQAPARVPARRQGRGGAA